MSDIRFRDDHWLALAKSTVLALAVWFIYAPAFHGSLFWDDPAEITGNLQLHSWSGLGKIWVAPGTPDYYPFKTTLQWVQWHLWGDSFLGYHLTNAGLHLLAALLLWRIFGRLGIRLAWTGALLFAVHPLAVESAAWMSELKNTLSLTLMLLSMLAWLNYDEILHEGREEYLQSQPSHFFTGRSGRSGSKTLGQECEPESYVFLPDLPGLSVKKATVPQLLPDLPVKKNNSTAAASRSSCKKWYFVSLLMFVLAMLSKTSVVMFPVILLLYGWWRRGRVGRRDLVATAPFFAVSLGLGLVTVWFQHFVAIKDIVVPQGGVLSRLAVAGMSVVFYAWKFVWPANLLPIYPRWHVDPPAVWQFWPWAAGALIGLWLWKVERAVPRTLSGQNADGGISARGTGRSTYFRAILLGVGFFVINLVPVMGFVKMSFMRISWVADHFAYLPMIGLVGLAAAALGEFTGEKRPKDEAPGGRTGIAGRTAGGIGPCLGIAVAALTAAMAILAREHAKIFRSETAAWEYTIQRNPDAWLAHNNLSNFYLDKGDIGAAMNQVQIALRLKSDFSEAHNNYGNILLQLGRTDEAKKEFEQAIALRRGYAEPINGLGNYYLDTNQPEQALACYERALKIRPEYSDCRNNLGAALERLGRMNDAISQYRQVIRENPQFAPAHYNLGIALGKTGKPQEAIEQYDAALRINPNLIQARNNFGVTLYSMNRIPDAIEQYEAALKVNPDFFEAQVNLANALLATHDFGGAILHYHAALLRRPGFASGHNSLGIALENIGHRAEARAEFEEALHLDPHFADAQHNLEVLNGGR